MIIDVNRTYPTASGLYTVEQVSSREEDLALWRHTVTLRAGEGDVTDLQALEAFRASGRLWVNIPPTLATMEIAKDNPPDTNPGLAVGLQPDTYRFRGSGVIASWDARFSVDFPVGADIIIDLLKNGVSIFPSGNANKINITAGSSAEFSGFRFVSDNLAYSDGDLLTMNVIQVGSTTPGKNGLVHLNLKPNTALPA